MGLLVKYTMSQDNYILWRCQRLYKQTGPKKRRGLARITNLEIVRLMHYLNLNEVRDIQIDFSDCNQDVPRTYKGGTRTTQLN